MMIKLLNFLFESIVQLVCLLGIQGMAESGQFSNPVLLTSWGARGPPLASEEAHRRAGVQISALFLASIRSLRLA